MKPPAPVTTISDSDIFDPTSGQPLITWMSGGQRSLNLARRDIGH